MTARPLPFFTLLAYAGPALGCGYMYLLVSLYVMKYATDLLFIGPALMGAIFSLSRIVDAVSDPVVGYLSDRTTMGPGRRRTWMLLSIIPVALLFFMIFTQPASLSKTALGWWMAVAIIGFYLMVTLCFIPQLSLGAELSRDSHQRNRLFGFRHAAYTLGSILALFSLQVFVTTQESSPEEIHDVVSRFAVYAALLFALLVLAAVVVLKEDRDSARTVRKEIYGSLVDVWRNRHARLLLVVTFIENIGLAAITVLTLYVTEYVLHKPLLSGVMILCYMLPSAALAPLWPRIALKLGKTRLWRHSMVLTGLSFGAMFPVMYFQGALQVPAMLVLVFIAGVAAGCGGTLGPSVQSDVIDFDEANTGERKQGTYFAAWNFVFKSAYGVMMLLTGFALQATGFVPQQEQTAAVIFAMISLYSLLPMACYLTGAWIFGKFDLNVEAERAADTDEAFAAKEIAME